MTENAAITLIVLALLAAALALILTGHGGWVVFAVVAVVVFL